MVQLSRYYPNGGDGSVPMAYLWARTVRCEGPGCGATVPLLKQLWLSKKGTRVALRLLPNISEHRIDFAVIENPDSKDVGPGTVKRGSATCPCCGFTTSVESVRRQLQARRGGSSNTCLYAVVSIMPGRTGRTYRTPTQQDIEAGDRFSPRP